MFAYDDAVGAMLDFARRDGNTLLIATSDHETGGASLGRGSVIGGLIDEAPLRTRSLRGAAAGVMAENYFTLPAGLDALASVSASAEVRAAERPSHARQSIPGVPSHLPMALRAPGPHAWRHRCRVPQAMTYYALADLAAITPGAAPIMCAPSDCYNGTAADAAVDALVRRVSTSPPLQAGLADALGRQIEMRAAIRVAEHEARFLLLAVASAPNANWISRMCDRAVASVISARARVGWTSWDHTAVDVPIHAYGPGAERFVGVHENEDVGAEIERLMGWNLQTLTASLGKPVIAAADGGAYAI